MAESDDEEPLEDEEESEVGADKLTTSSYILSHSSQTSHAGAAVRSNMLDPFTIKLMTI